MEAARIFTCAITSSNRRFYPELSLAHVRLLWKSLPHPPPKKRKNNNTCNLKRDHFKTKGSSSKQHFLGHRLVFGGVVLHHFYTNVKAIENGLFDDVCPFENGDQLLQSDRLMNGGHFFSPDFRPQKWVQTRSRLEEAAIFHCYVSLPEIKLWVG